MNTDIVLQNIRSFVREYCKDGADLPSVEVHMNTKDFIDLAEHYPVNSLTPISGGRIGFYVLGGIPVVDCLFGEKRMRVVAVNVN